ncbi:DsrE family protein [Guyparkeria hydrothermalis]|uniref:DsrE family protein n=1 Tax=Guyparkeria hydrothermalis TaxID=923 RepID=UPI0020212B0B|nr:DsrE family protein [Guyparkeria hydrothermalis]MCL7744738.1 DsrE family protein [Guyparkeria hydrothermalis]
MTTSMLLAGTPAWFARRLGRMLVRVLAPALLAMTMAAPAQADDTQRVVYHVDFADPTRYSATLTSINNLINDAEQQLLPWDVHLVLVGYGIRFATDDPLEGTPYAADEALNERRDELKGRLQTLIEIRDVKVHLCDFTRQEINLSKDKLYEGIGLVNSGVAKIAELQREGYAYLKIQ